MAYSQSLKRGREVAGVEDGGHMPTPMLAGKVRVVWEEVFERLR